MEYGAIDLRKKEEPGADYDGGRRGDRPSHRDDARSFGRALLGPTACPHFGRGRLKVNGWRSTSRHWDTRWWRPIRITA